MGKVVLRFQISLDGIVSDPDQWMSFSDDILKDSMDGYSHLDVAIFGSKSYPSMCDYWQKAEQSSKSPLEKEFAKKLNDTNKIVPSRSQVDLTWRNSQQLTFTNDQDFIRSIHSLKEEKREDISVESGIGTWKLFLRNDLFDELMFFVHPTIVGKGEKLFDEINPRGNLRLKNCKPLDRGVVKLHYEKTK